MGSWLLKIKIQSALNIFLDYFSRRRCFICTKNIACIKNSFVCKSCEDTTFSSSLQLEIKKISYAPRFQSDQQAVKIFFSMPYKDNLRKLMKSFKYRCPLLYKFWGQTLAKSFLKTFRQEDSKDFFVTNLPSHAKRITKRGYCHTHLIAKEFAKQLELKFIPNLITRVKDTETLYDKSQEQREEILENAFEFNPKIKLQNKEQLNQKINIILVDDITTSGLTFIEASSVIKTHLNNSRLICLACTGRNL